MLCQIPAYLHTYFIFFLNVLPYRKAGGICGSRDVERKEEAILSQTPSPLPPQRIEILDVSYANKPNKRQNMQGTFSKAEAVDDNLVRCVI